MTLREMRMAAGLTQIDAAEKIGCSPLSIGLWERGKGGPLMKWIEPMAQTYGVDALVVLKAVWEARQQ